MRPTSPGPLTGRTLDRRYLLGDLIARGGMGAVYRGEDQRLHRPVAVKVLKSSLAHEPGKVQRFEKEAQAAARITDPHVVSVWDQGLDTSSLDPLAYLVMELVEGATLRDLIQRRSPMTVREMFRVALPLAHGLDAAHRVGMVHRDVKPENVLISPSGTVKVTDFGLTHHVQDASETLTLVGSASYIAPELVRRQPAGMPADNYSAGIMMYEMLTGVPPFRGSSPYEVSLAHVEDPLPDLRARFPEASPEVAELISWCCDKNPELRPQTGEQLLDELEHCAATLTAAELDRRPPGYRAEEQDLFAVLGPDAHTDPRTVRLSRARSSDPSETAPGGGAAHGLGAEDPTEVWPRAQKPTGAARPVSGSARTRPAPDGQERSARASAPGHRPLDPRMPTNPLVRSAPHTVWVWVLLFLLMSCVAGFLGWMLGVHLLQSLFADSAAAGPAAPGGAGG